MDTPLPPAPDLRFAFDAATQTLRASLSPGSLVPSIDPLWLHDRLEDAGYAKFRLRTNAVTTLITQYNAGGRVIDLEIADAVDGALQITTSPDSMEARLTITPAEGGRAVTKDDVLEQLAGRGIYEGVRVEEINRAIAAGIAQEVVIARGREPVDGEDGRLEYLLPETRARVPNIRPSGRTDYRDLGEIQVVREGDALMRRHPPTAGTPGLDVTGRPIPPTPGRDQRFASGLRGVRAQAEDPDLLVAASDGQPVRVRGGMMVEPVYTVDTVDMTTGNIRFDGTVKVRGDVKAGMRIEASGDIEIGGVVEPATLDAGGNIVVKSGVLGASNKKDSANHRIHCDGSFSATYAQQARIEAGDSIFIDDLAMQCTLRAKNHIRIGNRRRGHVIGGVLHATLSIQARVIGAPNRIRTELEIGPDNTLSGALRDMVQLRDGKENQLLEIGKVLTLSDRQPGRIPAEMRDRAQQTAKTLSSEVESLRENEDAVRYLLDLARQARVSADQAMHEGVVVSMGEARLAIQGHRGPSTVRLAEHGLGVFALEDEGTPGNER
ncbi:DUF342 domain-containing protein [Thauera sp. 63]|uniref:DUF342 domain-containing protein n=1 Tax=Thauera sp. 63 TaxID=497321 RepID=UPI0002D07134|nr:FapA family protein [Thauera sp. 63]ENO76612.1 hypothetical protein C664_13734 [Thauera sp. 63]